MPNEAVFDPKYQVVAVDPDNNEVIKIPGIEFQAPTSHSIIDNLELTQAGQLGRLEIIRKDLDFYGMDYARTKKWNASCIAFEQYDRRKNDKFFKKDTIKESYDDDKTNGIGNWTTQPVIVVEFDMAAYNSAPSAEKDDLDNYEYVQITLEYLDTGVPYASPGDDLNKRYDVPVVSIGSPHFLVLQAYMKFK